METVGRDEQLAQVLVEFAHTLGTDFSVQRILDHLVERIVDILSVTGAGVMLAQGGHDLHFIAASDDVITTIEALQNELHEGPCWHAYRTGDAVAVADLHTDTRFPTFSRRAVHHGLAAVFTFPMRLNGERVGAVDLYRDVPGPLDEWDERAGQVLADVAAAYLYNAQARVDVSASLARLTHRSLHDPLTGLPNRTLFEELLEQAVARARRSHHRAAVLFIDLDRFKAVNDRHGHHVGDELLRRRRSDRGGPASRRLPRATGRGRVRGALRGPGRPRRGRGGRRPHRGPHERALPRRRSDVVRQCQCRDRVLRAGTGHPRGAPARRRPRHVRREEGRWRSRALVVPGAPLVADRRQDLEDDLSRAQLREELVVHYQPIVDVRTGRPTAVEALLRWEHPVRGTVLPDVVVASAERTGMILPIGEWVLRQTCLDARDWRREQPGLQVMVNVSAQQVTGPGFVRTVERVLGDTAVEPGSLCLEVTESVLLHDAARSLEVLRQLKQLGVGLSLDDFGTGYSSLSYLRQFPFDVLKIDRSFTQNVLDEQTTRSIVLAMIDLGHVLDLTITAEGIETAAEMESMIELGADHAQGFYISRPLPKTQLALAGPSGAAALKD